MKQKAFFTSFNAVLGSHG